MLMEKATKRISCQRCRLRKVRCSRVHPCNTCTAAGVECMFREEETKRRPVSREYVNALERKVGSYEQLIARLRSASGTERDKLLDHGEHTFLDGQIDDTSAKIEDGEFDYTGSSRRSTMYMLNESPGSSSFYGPTSVYPKEIMPREARQNSPAASYRTLERWHDARLHESLKFNHENFMAALESFFEYQHSQCMFIERGAFLRDYKALDFDSKYCSYPLLYAACALGARSGDSQLSRHADFFSHVSSEMISKNSIESPHLAIVQTLLCLALSELTQGHNTKGWMLSGMAFRMAQDLGLHQDPRFVVDDDVIIPDARDQEVRRRVYWGCYTIDKMISLYFGRPISLHEEDAAVNPVDPSIEIAEDNDVPEFIKPKIQAAEYDELLPTLLLHFSELSKIIESVLSQVFSTKMIKKSRKDLVMTRLERLEELNLRLFRWHSALPEAITWNRWMQKADGVNSNILTLHILYHSTLISLNRHFIRPTPGFARKNQSKEICMTSVDNIVATLRHYRSRHPLSASPIIFIYGAIMAGTALCFTHETHSATNDPAADVSSPGRSSEAEIDHQATSIVKILEEVAETCPPAREASLRLKERFGLSDSRRQGQQFISLRKSLGKRKRTDTSDLRDNNSNKQKLEDTLDNNWSSDPMALMSSMDPGILDLMPMDWPDVDNDDFWNLRNVGEGQI